MLHNLVQFLTSSWFVAAIGVLSLVLAGIGIVLTIKSQTRSRVAYQTRSWSLVGQPKEKSYGEVKILFEDQDVPRVSVSQIALWNAGNTTIHSTDLVTTDPLAVCFEAGTRVLGARWLAVTRPVNGCSVFLKRSAIDRATLSFEFLDAGDGLLLELVHTGTNRPPTIKGTIKGIPAGAENWGSLKNREDSLIFRAELRSIAFRFVIALSGPLALALLIAFAGRLYPRAVDVGIRILLGSAMGLVLLAWTFALWARNRQRLPRTLWSAAGR